MIVVCVKWSLFSEPDHNYIEGYLLQDPAQLHVICDFKQTQFSIFPWFLE